MRNLHAKIAYCRSCVGWLSALKTTRPGVGLSMTGKYWGLTTTELDHRDVPCQALFVTSSTVTHLPSRPVFCVQNTWILSFFTHGFKFLGVKVLYSFKRDMTVRWGVYAPVWRMHKMF